MTGAGSIPVSMSVGGMYREALLDPRKTPEGAARLQDSAGCDVRVGPLEGCDETTFKRSRASAVSWVVLCERCTTSEAHVLSGVQRSRLLATEGEVLLRWMYIAAAVCDMGCDQCMIESTTETEAKEPRKNRSQAMICELVFTDQYLTEH